MADNSSSPASGPSHFPAHEAPRVWVLSSGDSPIGIALARQVLLHGDCVVAGVRETNSEREDPRSVDFEAFYNDVLTRADLGYGERLRARSLDIRMMSACQAIIAEAINIFGKVDIVVCCTSQAVIGSVEELAASERTLMLVRDQFETNYFGPVNIIKAALPHMRKQKWGHIMVTGGITGHIGTPGLGVYCAAGWALEGYCDSLAYEIAPFNIRVTILQGSIEIGILTNLITSVPPILPAYSPATNHAPLFRGILNGLLSRLPNVEGRPQSPEASSTSPAASSSSPSSSRQDPDTEGTGDNLPLSAPFVVSLYPPLSPAHLDALTLETVHAITAIGGHENPPARHIIGSEGVASVKEKLKTVSEELEDFIECSSAVDINTAEESGSAPKAIGDDVPMPMNL